MVIPFLRMTAIVRDGDLFENTHRYAILVQQCNCVTTKAHGLSLDIARIFGSYANPYALRQNIHQHSNLAEPSDRPSPGTVQLLWDLNETSNPAVACVYGQWSPGAPSSKLLTAYPLAPGENRTETALLRERWFSMGLTALAGRIREGVHEPVTIAFPYHIGCGLAGGDWAKYTAMITGFADEVGRCGHEVVIYRKRM
jgi:hypothetical protein